MLTTFIVQVLNKPEALERISGLLRRRAIIVQSWATGLDESHLLRMTLQLESDEDKVRLIEINLRKLPYVIRVDNVTSWACIVRELALIKIATTSDERPEVMQIASAFRAHIVHICSRSIVIEATGDQAKINALIDALSLYGIVDLARTGSVAMPRSLSSLGSERALEVGPLA